MDRPARRFALEAIASATDSTASERLRAIELLREFEADDRRALSAEAEGISPDLLDEELADVLAPVGGGRSALEADAPLGRVLASALAGPERWPGLHAAIGAG
jgi:hypothetical protein